MAASDATPFPFRGVAYRVSFPIMNVNGDLVSAAAGLDSEVSKDGLAYADCTAEAIEIGTSGTYHLDLSAAEMTADTIVIVVKTTTTDAKPTTLVLYPITNGLDIPVDTRYVGGTLQTPGDLAALIGNIGSAGGAALQVDAKVSNATGAIPGVTSGTPFVGTEVGTIINTSALDGIFHQVTGTATNLDIVYQFLTGGDTSPVSCVWTGYVQSNNDTATFLAWNHEVNLWEVIGTLIGQNGVVTSVKNMILYGRYRGTSNAELGKVYIRIAGGIPAGTPGTNPILATDQVYVSYAVTSRTVGYADGSVWIDTLLGVPGTELFVNGTADNPVSNFTDAVTIANALGVASFHIGNGSSIVLTQDLAEWTWKGASWSLNLNGRSITSCAFAGCFMTGLGTGAFGHIASFHQCVFDNATLPQCVAISSLFASNVGMQANQGRYLFLGCGDALGGIANPRITFAAGNSLHLQGYSGGIEIANLAAGGTGEFNGNGRCTLLASCTGGDFVLAGCIDLTRQDGNAVTVSDLARRAEDQGVAFVTTPPTDMALQSTLLLVKGKTDNLPPDPADASDIAASFLAMPGNIWSALIPGAFGPGTAGFILGTRLDVPVSSVSADGAPQLVGTFTRKGSTYIVNAYLLAGGVLVPAGDLSLFSIVALYGKDGTPVVVTATVAPQIINVSGVGLLYAEFTTAPAPASDEPINLRLSVTYNAVATLGTLQAVAIS